MALLHYNRIPAKSAAVAAAVGSVSSMDKRKGSSCQYNDDDDDTQDAKIMGCSFPDLPEDIWFSIHSLMPMREAARVACLSRAFLRSWQCRPNLIFNSDTVGMDPNGSMCGGDFSRKVDRILSKHSGTGVKIFRLDYFGLFEYNASRYLERWLQVAVKPGIEELTLMLSKTEREYNFPCSLLSDGIGSSIRHLKLRFCALRPATELGPLRNLTTLQLLFVSITGDELEGLLYNSLALEHLDICQCREMICLKIPCALQQLSSLNVFHCERLETIESKAPNLSSFGFMGRETKFSLGDTLKIKKLYMDCGTMVSSARTELPLHMPNLETLVISSSYEVVNTPTLPSKFLYLKHLNIDFVSGSTPLPSYDYFSLVCPVFMEHESTFLNPSDMR
ncbi:hypothetical protein EJB05_10126 [Eragrostis curvula]|uniref:At1g61320/AtMIF1 LRR domain-containing protein n=1 Tax=Eragrostis curvula TaxID=38414 RepID=A0A5J9W8C0_9POAL|nr:hypothetical protein EJB05_10126 [Eragrostis curvula]